MKPNIIKIVTIGVVILLALSVDYSAAYDLKATGIGLRGTFWQLNNSYSRFVVTNDMGETSVHTGTGGGWLFLLARINPSLLFELGLGAVGKVEEETIDYFNTDVDVQAITPLLLGLRLELFAPTHPSSLRPYLSVGGGPYWVSTIKVRDRLMEEEVSVETKLKRGGYLGAGTNFMITNWFALNFDLKYHFINFNTKHANSGFEYGLGVSFMWGKFSN